MPEGEEKTLPATPKRRLEARKKGQVARSQELGAAATLLALTIALHATLPGVAGQTLILALQSAFAFNPHDAVFNFGTVHEWQMRALLWSARLILPVLLLALVLGLSVSIAQVGLQVTPESAAPQWARLNPMSGIKRLVSMHGLVDLGKGILKLLIIGGIGYSTLRGALDSGELLRTMRMPLPTTLSTVGGLLWTLGLRIAITLLVLAIADYIYQKHSFEKGIKMSRFEVKEEGKQSEGSPETKGRIRRMQREISRRRMMQAVPKADVVVTNPTHFAVALQYVPGASAPKVVAKGQGYVAQRIKEIARENHIPIVENKPLAQSLHKTVEVGQEIPGDLYEAVAQILAFVYRTYGRRAHG